MMMVVKTHAMSHLMLEKPAHDGQVWRQQGFARARTKPLRDPATLLYALRHDWGCSRPSGLNVHEHSERDVDWMAHTHRQAHTRQLDNGDKSKNSSKSSSDSRTINCGER